MPWSWPHSGSGSAPGAKDRAAPCSWPWSFPAADPGTASLPGDRPGPTNQPCCPCLAIRTQCHPPPGPQAPPSRPRFPKRKPWRRTHRPSLLRTPLRRHPNRHPTQRPSRHPSRHPSVRRRSSVIPQSRFRRNSLLRSLPPSPKSGTRRSRPAQTSSPQNHLRSRPTIHPGTKLAAPKPRSNRPDPGNFRPEPRILRKAWVKRIAPAHPDPEPALADKARQAREAAELRVVWQSSAHPAGRVSSAWLSPDIRTKQGAWARKGSCS